MSDTATSGNQQEEARVTGAIDELLADHDPKEMDYEEFRGAQFDHGLAWVYFDEGHGGLGGARLCKSRWKSGCAKLALHQ